MIKVLEKNSGSKIAYEVIRNKICFDDDLTINLEKREEDESVHIDVCYDEEKRLVIGAAAGRYYVAEIDIPPRKYREETVEQSESSIEQEGTEEIITEPQIRRIAEPFKMDDVTLTLWAIE